jgi:hypothetical protein
MRIIIGGIMRKAGQHGFSLIQLMIILVMVSVIATAFWNLSINRMQSPYNGYRDGSNNSVKMALDEIGYHLGLAGYGLKKGDRPLEILKKKKSEELRIRHNDICFEFYVDKDNKLVKKVENSVKVIAENINSLNTAELGRNKIIVTLSTIALKEDNENKIETLSKSYSVVIEMKSLM